MDCNAYRILITGYLDGELSDDEVQMLKTHLQTCGSCLTYLKRMETMETVLKRYTLLQEVPEVPQDFAHNISAILQGITEKKKLSLAAKMRQKYREFVLDIVEKWVGSLRTRPFAWMASASFLVVLIAAVVSVNIFETVYEKKPLQYPGVSPEPVIQVAQKEKSPVERKSIQFPAVAPEPEKRAETDIQAIDGGEPIEYVDVDVPPVSTFRAPKPGRTFKKEDEKSPVIEPSRDGSIDDESVVIEALRDRSMDDEPVEVAEEAFIRFTKNEGVAKNENVSVEGYVYSHIIEVSQDQFIDDAMFVGYVQDTLFE